MFEPEPTRPLAGEPAIAAAPSQVTQAERPARFLSFATAIFLALTALGAGSLFYWLTVQRPDRARLQHTAAHTADLARSLSRRQGYVDRYVTPVQVNAFGTGAPQPAAHWSPMFPALTGMWFGLTGEHSPRGPLVIGALGFCLALVAVYGVTRALLGRSLSWVAPLVVALHPEVLKLATSGAPHGLWAGTLIMALGLLILPGRSAHHVAAAGVLWGIGQLMRPVTLWFLPAALTLAGRPRLERDATPRANGDVHFGAPTGDVAADTTPARETTDYMGPEDLTDDPVVCTADSGDTTFSAPDPPPRSGTAWPRLALVAGFTLLLLIPWFIFRAGFYGSTAFELEHYALLHGLGPWHGDNVVRSLFAPEPWVYILGHPLEFAGKWLANWVKLPGLIALRLLNPVQLLMVVAGMIALYHRPAGRRAVLAILAVTTIQGVVSAATTLDPAGWVPMIILWAIPAAAGLRSLAYRVSRTWPEAGAVAILLIGVVLPFGHAALDAYARPQLGPPPATETDAQSLGAWVQLLVPEGHAILSDLDGLVWYGDRPVLALPIDTSEAPELLAVAEPSFALWRDGPGVSPSEEHWGRFFERAMSRGALVKMGELRLNSGYYVLAAWR